MIYVSLKGRLGNQMFIYAYAYVLSKENNNESIVLCDKNNYRLHNYNVSNIIDFEYIHPSFIQKILRHWYFKKESMYTRERLFLFEKKYQKLLNKFGLYYCQNGFLQMENKNKKRKKYVNGYFQSEKYFNNYKDDIKKIFIPNSPVKEENLLIYNDIKNNENSVCVDFRMEDYVKHPLHGVCTYEYYKNAMTYISTKIQNPKFYVFTTDLKEVKDVVKDWPFNIVFEDGKSEDYEKLRLMSACSHFIITNSSYDWWAQYLSESKNKIVVAPSRWFNGNCPCDIYLEDWVLLDC